MLESQNTRLGRLCKNGEETGICPPAALHSAQRRDSAGLVDIPTLRWTEDFPVIDVELLRK